MHTAASPADELSGIVGLAAHVIEALGAWGVGVATLAETAIPPIPSEVILPLAGYLAQQGSMNLVLAILAGTVGAYLGALLLYGIGRRLGLERSIRLLSRIPLVDRDDLERAARGFSRHGRSAVFFGRLVPGVRSLISLPAGASGMDPFVFSIFTVAGSGLWNSVLIGLGALLGTQYALVNEYSRYLNYAVYAVMVGIVLSLVVRRVRRHRRGDDEDDA